MCRIFLLLLSSYLVHCDQIGTTIVVDCKALLNYEQKRVKWTDMVGNFTEAERQHLSDDLQSSIDKNIRHSIFRGALLQTRITAIEEKLNGTIVQVYLYFDTEKLKQLNQNVLANQITMQKYLRKQFSGHRNGLSLNSVRVLDIYLLEPLEVKAFYCKGTVFSQKESPEQIRNILNRNSPHYMHAVSGITIQFVTSLEQCALDSALKSADTDVVRLGARKSHPSIQSKAVLEFAYDSLALIDPQFFGLHGAKHLSNMLKTVWKRDQWCHPCADTPWCIGKRRRERLL
ncbi:hypothetical protein D915_008702 [Fasciola hepatica]|uniref:Uncharacterized protein n=1 Tax=Fasciola hepatica TaxID=6192 RepID=A0A4E0QZL5_FASHE|nr:hypothetical protein D915_008702 [Fasciola hepatica]